MNKKMIINYICLLGIGFVLGIMVMEVTKSDVELVNEFVTTGYCYSIEDYTIRIDNVTYHCGYINRDNKQQFVGKYIEIGFTIDDNLLFHINSIKEVDIN